ncbi:hypothetical protein [Yoonia sp. I 8.24]|uniref:hypothetical protein n=1 Tax=Yoonia sp. I 8.24 TaxID=1537229 RepID=UPI001EDEA754|nr:hypothetical protein [Yoonia sp. I 8.24]MCG3267600.1 hypothetical protein [Yoonia sp. I 8.24]
MKIFPNYRKKERREETKISFEGLLFSILLFSISCGIFVWGGSDFPPVSDGAWNKVRWASLLVSILAFFLFLQSLLEFAIAATVGPERFFAAYFLIFAAFGAVAWFFR